VPVSSLLIIDDDSMIRRSLVELFQEKGTSHIREAASAEEGFRILEEEPFALIICDHHLPGMTGLAFMGKLRLKHDQTPILLITGIENKEPVKQAVNQLKAGFLAKPFSSEQLFEAVEVLLS
jgi:DNA-binding NtrC family response regulator